MKIAEITIETKKGQAQKLRFLVETETPFPDIEGGGSFRWRNDGGILPRYSNAGGDLKNAWYCYLLADGVNIEEGQDYNRQSFAGYEGRPGTFAIRGRDMGEMSVYLEETNPTWARVQVRGFETPTDGERALIMAQIVEPLRAFCLKNKAELRRAAIEKIRQTAAGRIAGMREAADKLAKEMEDAISKL